MKVILTKPPIPLLWLDTWCILELAAASDSKDIKRKERAENIIDRIISLTKKKRLFCPKGDQDIEIGISNNKKIVEKSREIQTQMSLGISLNLYAVVEHLQTKRMMKAVIEGETKVEFPWRDVLADDPIRTIDRNDKYLVTVQIPLTQEQIDEQIRTHKSIAKDWETLRLDARKNKRGYEATLAKEFKGTAKAIARVMANITAKTIHRLPISTDEYMNSLDLVGTPLSWWGRYSGKEGALIEMLSFYGSSEYTQIPFVNVGTRLLAELVSGNETVSPSDVMDIHHIATTLPYATYMVVDKRIRNRLESRTRLTKDYPVKLLKWREILPLLESLDG